VNPFRLALIVLALSTKAFSQPPSAAPPPSIALPSDLDRVLRDYERAWRSHDAKALSELFDPEGFVLASGRPPVRGRTAIQSEYAGAGGALSLRAFAYFSCDNVAYIIGGFGPLSSGPDIGKFVLTLSRHGAGPWMIVSDMDNANQHRAQEPHTSVSGPTPPSTSATPP